MRDSFFLETTLALVSSGSTGKKKKVRIGLSAGMLGISVKPPYGAYLFGVGLER